MRKGFTLIELLAVIVILAIIALIATPIVLNIIEDAKESATLRSAEFYLDGVEQSILLSRLNSEKVKDGKYYIMENGNICLETPVNNTCPQEKTLEVSIKGEKPQEGTIKIKNGQIQKVDLKLSEKEVWTDPFTGDLAYKLAPGLYDKNDKLLMSWDELNKFTLAKTNNEYDFNDLIGQGGVEIGEDDYVSAGIIIDSIENAYKLIISGSVESIASFAFYDCQKLTTIIIEEGVKTIGEYAFSDSCLTSIIIPGSIESIGEEAFSNSDLINVIIEEGVKTIDHIIFMDCESLTNVIIPESVESIGDAAFIRCTKLKEITIPESVTNIGDEAFSDCTSLTSITIPEGVTEIGWSAFYGCTGLTSITIPNSVTSIGEIAFAGCTGLTSITIPESVTYIGDSAFAGCTGLTSITIPNSVTSIGYEAFYGCTGLTSITIPNINTTIDETSFSGCGNLDVYYKGDVSNKPWGAQSVNIRTDF